MKRLVKLIRVAGAKPDNLEGKAAELYEGLAQNRWQDDESARQALYGNDRHRSIYYANTKRELAKQLTNVIINQEPNPEHSEMLRTYDDCYKKFTTIKLLLGRGAREVAVQEAEKVFKKSDAYGLTEISLSLAQLLRKHYGEIDPKKKKYQKYKEAARRLQELQYAEDLAEQLHSDLMHGFLKSKAFNQEMPERGVEYIKRLMPFLERHQSFRLHYTANNILVTIYQLRSDHQKVIETCRKALDFFAQQPDTRRSALFSFQFKMIPSFIQLQRFAEAKVTIRKCLEMSEEGSHNWVITKQYEAMLGFYSGDYLLAHNTIKAVKKRLQKSPHLQEQWLIYEAYAEFLVGEELSQRTFRLSKFLNEIPTYSTDKRGMNINLLIIQTLFLLKRGKTGKIIDQAEALQRYTYRHLKPDHTFRSNCFIKMLLLLPSCHFNRIAVERKSAQLRERLQSMPIDLAKQDHDLEVVPYEVLWERVLGVLE